MQLSPSTKFDNTLGVTRILVDNPFAQASVSLYGGHVLSFCPKSDGRERLWLSKQAVLDGSKAIRGGIPVCWPWFSDSHGQDDVSLPAHGYLRTQTWQLISSQDHHDHTELKLVPAATQGPGFSYEAEVSLVIKIGQTMSIDLHTHNPGPQPFAITCALHTYFAISDIRSVELKGIEGQYKDKTRNWQVSETPAPYRFSEETDRVHHCKSEQVTIHTEGDITKVGSTGHDSLVVWNPWQEKSVTMGDMEDSGYQTMVCVETAVTDGFTLAPGTEHHLIQTIA